MVGGTRRSCEVLVRTERNRVTGDDGPSTERVDVPVEGMEKSQQEFTVEESVRTTPVQDVTK